MTVTFERVHQLLSYNSETGNLIWKEGRGNQYATKNSIAGWLDEKGYIRVEIDGRVYRAHRLIWFMTHKEWPTQVDHWDKVKSNNRLDNLRKATNQQNRRNVPAAKSNTSGFKGVTFEKSSGLWRARICDGERRLHLGRFKTAREASIAYENAAEKVHGDFYYGGS